MKMCTVKVRRDALTEITIEVPQYEVPVLRNLHGLDMVRVVETRDVPPPAGKDGEPLTPRHLWDTLQMKYTSAAKEDRKENTGHPADQTYGDYFRFETAVLPMLKVPKVRAPKPPPKPKRSHHKKPTAIAPPVSIEA